VDSVQSFHKIHLVPFGEYVPLIETFPWLVALTPYHGTHIPSLSFGPGPTWMEMGNYRLATAICFEDTVPHVVRRFFSETKDGRQPDLLLNMSNDGWFCVPKGGEYVGSEEQEMHLAVSVFRAIENRVPLARAANTGVSAIVDGNGRVVKSLGTMKHDVLSGEVPLDDRTSFYSARGDWLGQSCLAVTIGLVPLAFFWPGRAVSPRVPSTA
jgi:apolipoprotein N-acyltransferase